MLCVKFPATLLICRVAGSIQVRLLRAGVAVYLKEGGLMKNQKGFTLIELVVVMTILTIVSAFVYPKIAGYMQTSNEHYRQNQEYMVNKALVQYYALTGRYYIDASHTAMDSEITNADDMLDELKKKTGAFLKDSGSNYKYIKKGGADAPDWYISKVEVQLIP
jgi:prepilin-type N-terminal cleavage/methylation domain-containing protein